MVGWVGGCIEIDMFALMSGWVDGLLCNGGWAGGRVERRGRNRLHALFSSSEEASRGDFPITLLRFLFPVHRVFAHTPQAHAVTMA